MKRLALVALASVLVLAACGSGGSGGSSGSPAAQIKANWASFFSPKTTISDKVALLQDGPKFRPVIQSFASNPFARQVSATVQSVTLQGANRAKVVYVLKIGGKTPLGAQTGTAVKRNGQWKVGSESLCSLIELGGTAPPQCTK